MTIENLNMDFSRPVMVPGGASPWIPSPLPGVERRPLARAGAESGHATSIVRYRPGSAFAPHTHGGGEEFLVLEGVFSDETGDFPVGSYVRNPIGSRHQPSSAPGCVIFVKLCQMARHETAQTVVDTAAGAWQLGSAEGHQVMALYRDARETVTLERLAPGAGLPPHGLDKGGQELLIMEGDLTVEGAALPVQSWIRRPPGAPVSAASDQGALLWIKRGHLSDAVL